MKLPGWFGALLALKLLTAIMHRSLRKIEELVGVKYTF